MSVWATAAWAGTVAYWRFDDARDPEILAEVETVAPGQGLPDSDGQTVWRKAVHDYSGNGNHLTTWEYAWAGHNWSDDVPATLIPSLGLDNALSVTAAGSWPAMMTWSAQSQPTGVDLETWQPQQWTIEASFETDNIDGNHTFVGRDDMNVSTEYPSNASLYFAVRNPGALDIQFTDVQGFTHYARSADNAIQPNTWYNVAATCDGSTLSLYINNELVASTDLTASGSTDTTMALSTNSGADWHAGTWTVTRGLWNGGHTDRFYGHVDEIRISDVALDPSEFLFGKESPKAKNPIPANLEPDAPRQMVLRWSPGTYPATHTVHFGQDYDTVLNSSSPIAEGLDVNQLDVGTLELGQTYYWRVDEVNLSPDHTVTVGNVWSFTVEPVAYPLPMDGVTATASSASEGKTAEQTINGSGMNADDQHGNDDTTMWFSSEDDAGPAWIAYEFDKTYNLHELWIWNGNYELEPVIGFGIQRARVEVSTDGNDWTVVDANVLIPQALGSPAADVSLKLAMGDVPARFVKITALDNWSTLEAVTQVSLSEVRFTYVPMAARLPQPADGATNVPVGTPLSWRAGRQAAHHEVFFSGDETAVIDGTAPVGTTTEAQFDLSGQDVTFGRTFYWRVDEVNEAESVSRYVGPVWSFSTPEFVAVDDMESYDDDLNLIYERWADGYNDPANGSQVGHLQAPFAEQAVVHGGAQSMPYYYDNTGGVTSTAVKDFGGQDWTRGGLQTLVLYFLGQRDNTGGQLFLEIGGQRVVCPSSLDTGLWTQWNVDLAAFGADLSNVGQVTLGVQGNGRGLLYIDDIRLYHEAPAVVSPVDPGTTGLALWYDMEGDIQDKAGSYDGTTNAVLLYSPSLDGLGSALDMDGIEDVVEMPIGDLIAGLTDSTFACWVNLGVSDGSWQRAFDVGTGTDNYLFLCPRIATTGPARAAILTPDSGGEIQASTERPLSDGWHHLAVVFDQGMLTLYVDGEAAQSVASPVTPMDLGPTTQNYLGDSQWEADSLLLGLLDEFRIYQRALSAGEIRFLAGDR